MAEHWILDDDGNEQEADLLTWAKWLETTKQRILSRTEIGDAEVSTVFLGLDHSFGSGPRLIWETLVFGGELDGDMDRYSTRAEAQAGHDAMCEKVRAHPVTKEQQR